MPIDMETWACPNCSKIVRSPRIRFPVWCSCGKVHLADNSSKGWEKQTPESIAKLQNSVEGKLRRSFEDFPSLASRKIEGAKAWRELHTHEGQPIHDPQADLKWLSEVWEPLIPRFGCSCAEFYAEYKMHNPPDFTTPESRFRWGVNLHNAVNQKLDVEQWSIDQAFAYWRPHKHYSFQQPPVKGVVAVTSLSPLEHHKRIQAECVSSWRRLGLEVISGNFEHEIASLRSEYPDVQFEPVKPSKLFDRPTPRIFDLLQLGGERAVLLINSDIAIYSQQDWLVDAISNQTAIVGIRQNWTSHPGDATPETWGIDAFLLFPSQIETIPDLDLAIGQPTWDYWIAFHMQFKDIPIQYFDRRVFFHQRHPLHWTTAGTDAGLAAINAHYGEVEWNAWRQDFGRGKRELHLVKDRPKICSIRPITMKQAQKS
jgi:hypothetical protein